MTGVPRADGPPPRPTAPPPGSGDEASAEEIEAAEVQADLTVESQWSRGAGRGSGVAVAAVVEEGAGS